jgi:single-strand DNA-binding protein
VLLEGRLQRDEWEDKEGNKRSKVKVVAERVQFLGSPRDGQNKGRPAEESGPGRAETEKEPPAPADQDLQDDDNLPF